MSPPETKSSRLDDFCSSSNSFYGLNSSMGLSSPCTHRCVILCLIRSPTCSFGPIVALPIHSLHFTLFYLSVQTTLFVLSPLSPCDSLCVVGQELLQTEGVFLLRVDRVPPAARKVHPRVVQRQLGHIPSIRHHLERRKSTTNFVEFCL